MEIFADSLPHPPPPPLVKDSQERASCLDLLRFSQDALVSTKTDKNFPEALTFEPILRDFRQ